MDALAARSSYQELQLRDLLRGVEAEDVMAGELVRIPPQLSLQDAVDDYFMRYDHGAFPVEEGGRTVGLLTLRGVRRVLVVQDGEVVGIITPWDLTRWLRRCRTLDSSAR